MIDEFGQPPPPVRVIQCFRLGEYLQAEVPRLVAAVNSGLRQAPDFIAESHRPKYLALVGPSERTELQEFTPPPATPSRLTEMAASFHLGEYFTAPGILRSEGLAPTDPVIEAQVKAVQEAKGTSHFETSAGFSVFGIPVVQVGVAADWPDVFRENERDADNIHLHNLGALTALIRFANGSGIAAPVLPGFIGTVLVQEGQVASIAYAPVEGTPRYIDYLNDAAEVERRRAFAAVAMGHGYFRVEKGQAKSFAGFVRELKAFDPVLGLFAAYAYAQAGLQDDVEDVHAYMAKENVPMLFDVAMLANGWLGPVAPFCPLLRQSWATLAGRNIPPNPLLDRAGPYLLPGLWTTFKPEGMAMLFEALNRGEIQ